MKTQTHTYTYDPSARSLTMIINGKPRGGFWGPAAERKFNELLESGADIHFTNMDTENAKKSLIRRFHASLAHQGIMDYKQEIVGRYGVKSTTELSTDQLRELVDEYTTYNRQVDNAKIRSLRSDILTILNKLGVYVNNTDWTAVNAYLMDKRIAGKLLWQIDEKGLLELRRKLQSIFYKAMNAESDIERQQLLN